MKRKLILPSSVETDLKNHIIYLAENAGVEIASRFDHAILESFDLLRGSPFIGVQRVFIGHRLQNLRMWFVKDFEDYLIFYRVLDESVQIVRVLNSSQDTENIISVENDDPANLIS